MDNKVKRIVFLLCVVTLAAPAPAQAQSSAAHKVPMHPHQLTLYPNGRPKPRHSAHSYTQHRFNQPSPIHNTFMAPRYY